MGLAIKAVVARASGTRFEGVALTEFLIDHIKHNRDEFQIIYQGDIQEDVQEDDVIEYQDDRPVYTAGTLKAKFDKEGVRAILASLGVDIEGECTKDTMIAMILEAQKKGKE